MADDVETPRFAVDRPMQFRRSGNDLYLSGNDKRPVATLGHDRIKTADREALPGLITLAKQNGWTSIKVAGDEDFKRAAFVAAAAQGLKVDGYKPDDRAKAAPDREQQRSAGVTENAQVSTRTTNQTRDAKEQAEPRGDLAERFRRQTDVQNAKDPELRKAQSHVAFATVVAASRFPDDQMRQREFVTQRKEDVAARLGRGETITGVEVKAQQQQREREITQEQVHYRPRSPGR